MNDIFILINSYFLLIYTDFVPDRNTRYFMGWFNIAGLVLMVLLNLAVLII